MKYCDICKKETETKIVNKKETYEVYGSFFGLGILTI